MADHGFNLNTTEESIYQAYLTKTAQTDTAMMAKLKASLTSQVTQTIKEAGIAKFNSLSVADQITFIG